MGQAGVARVSLEGWIVIFCDTAVPTKALLAPLTRADVTHGHFTVVALVPRRTSLRLEGAAPTNRHLLNLLLIFNLMAHNVPYHRGRGCLALLLVFVNGHVSNGAGRRGRGGWDDPCRG